MEISFEPDKAETCAKQLDECVKILKKKHTQVMEVIEELRKADDTEAWVVICRKLERQSEEIQKQCKRLNEMRKVLRKVTRMYERCEEEIAGAGETKSKQYAETLGVVYLSKPEQFRIVLK